jgi:signal transduction histidine kinase
VAPYNAGMARLRPDAVFRLGALVGCGIIALPYVTRLLAGDGMAANRGLVTRLTLASGPVLLAAVFGAAFWHISQAGGRRPWLTYALLGVQVLIGFTLTDFFFLIAAEVPFVFRPRGALIWLVGQLTLFAALVVAVAKAGDEVAIPEMAGMVDALAVPVTIVVLGGWQTFAFAVGYLASAEQRSRRDLEQRARELLATQQMLADSSRVAERAHLARELHDTIGHALTVLHVNLELARHLTDGRAGEAVGQAQTVGKMLMADVREIVHASAEDAAIDLRGALVTLADGASAPAIELSLPETLHVDDPATAHAVFRCVQEAITNAMRHAGASRMSVAISQDAGGVVVKITDDGRGTDALTPGFGLTAMRQRLEAVDGRVAVQAASGRGVVIEAWVPALRARS